MTPSFLLDFFRNMEVEDASEFQIIKVTKLGLPEGPGKKIAPIMISLRTQDQRNNILKAGSKLPTGITMERDIPPPYRSCYKRYKKHAWKLRAMHGVKTQIVFDLHVMIFRYREEGKSFTIVDEFIPQHYASRSRTNKNPPQGQDPPPL